MNYKIPFNKPLITGKEIDHVAKSISSGHIAGDGPFTKKCQMLIEQKMGAKRVFLTVSCTAALEMAAILCEVGPRDEVILPSFSHVSTANAFCMQGAKPVFVDIRPDTLNIDETKIGNAITEHTKVIVPVHYAGISCEMDEIMRIARGHGLFVVEDAAQGFNARYNNEYLGTIGDIGAYSFHETKNVICGEGGAIVINNESFIERAEIIRDKGTTRSKFFRGEVEKYTWVDIGSSYLPSDLLAAFLYEQLGNIDKITRRRREIYNSYYQALLPFAHDGHITLPVNPPQCCSNGHLFYIILKDESTRDALISHLKTRGICAVFHFLPLHLSPVGRKLGYRENQLPVTESISCRLLRLPFYYDLKPEEQAEVIDAIAKVFIKNKWTIGKNQ
jgi:dTDP-4-amino-4,6-dideoxygalactose transaminase